MNRAQLRLWIGGLVVLSGTAMAAGTALTADQIIARSAAARGGLEAWKKIHAMVWTGHIEAGGSAVGSVPFIMELGRPNKIHFEILVQNNKSMHIFDGDRGWDVRPKREGTPEVQDYSAQEVGYARDALGLDGPLMDYKAKGVNVVALGRDVVDGHKSYVLVLKLPSGVADRVWIDTHSFLELKSERQAAGNTGRKVSVYYRNYQNVQGLIVPMTIETGDGRVVTTDKMVIERVELNAPLPDSAFTKPVFFNRHSVVSVGESPAQNDPYPGNR